MKGNGIQGSIQDVQCSLGVSEKVFIGTVEMNAKPGPSTKLSAGRDCLAKYVVNRGCNEDDIFHSWEDGKDIHSGMNLQGEVGTVCAKKNFSYSCVETITPVIKHRSHNSFTAPAGSVPIHTVHTMHQGANCAFNCKNGH